MPCFDKGCWSKRNVNKSDSLVPRNYNSRPLEVVVTGSGSAQQQPQQQQQQQPQQQQQQDQQQRQQQQQHKQQQQAATSAAAATATATAIATTNDSSDKPTATATTAVPLHQWRSLAIPGFMRSPFRSFRISYRNAFFEVFKRTDYFSVGIWQT